MVLNEKLKDYRLILASGSPRRRELLKGIRLEYETCSLDVDESVEPDWKAEEIPLKLSQKKSFAFGEIENEKTILITADTIVWLNNEMIGKPENEEEARKMLRKLSGNCHKVFTGVTLRNHRKTESFTVESSVWFRELDDEEINFYVSHFKPLDKAGSYGVQEWIGFIGIERIEGSYFNVMGLPTQRLYIELGRFTGNISQ